jgi:hypothetical protein
LKIAIIGAGWYGCHIASCLIGMGNEVVVFEKNSEVLCAASGNNQFRLHQGFHYARNYRTRIQSREGFSRFVERYSNLSAPILNNIYSVPDSDSIVDFLTYRLIMSASGLDFTEVNSAEYDVANCCGSIRVTERKLLTKKSRLFFTTRLGDNLRLSQEGKIGNQEANYISVNGERFDYIVDATWGGIESLNKKVFFESTLLLYYHSKSIGDFALTMVDGPLCSIYPCEEAGLFTLSSVPFTPLGRFGTAAEAWSLFKTLSSSTIDKQRSLMENQIAKYFPSFSENFEYIGPQFSVKTKIVGADDDRSCYVGRSGRLFKVLSGKIDTIFYAADYIASLIESDSESISHVKSSMLQGKADIGIGEHNGGGRTQQSDRQLF